MSERSGAAAPAVEHSVRDGALVTDYLRHVAVQKRLAERTCILYALDLEKLRDRAGASGVGLLEVQPHHVRQWVAQMHSGGRSPRGIALILSGWRGFYHWLGKQAQIERNPVLDVPRPKAGQPLPKALSVDQAVGLATHRDRDQDPVRDARDHCMVALLYGCGLRLAELTGLDTEASPSARGWFDLAAGELQVLGKGSKWRSVPLGGAAAQALREWLLLRRAWATDSAALFIGCTGKRITANHLAMRLRQRSQQAGLAGRVHPHMLRHSYASHLLQSSGDLRGVQELLGHASIGSTQVYTRLDFQHLARIYDAAHPRARN